MHVEIVDEEPNRDFWDKARIPAMSEQTMVDQGHK